MMLPRTTQVLLAALLLGACSESPRVGVVDVQAAYQRSPLMMVSALEIKKELGKTDRELKQRGRALAELRQQLEHGNAGSDAEKRALAARIDREGAELVQLESNYRLTLEAARKRTGEAMLARVEEVARHVAERRGLDLLVRKGDALYQRPDADLAQIDLTDEVARALLEKINPTEIPEPAEPSAP
jgi:Skp family chaperone for outer membrane proteins